MSTVPGNTPETGPAIPEQPGMREAMSKLQATNERLGGSLCIPLGEDALLFDTPIESTNPRNPNHDARFTEWLVATPAGFKLIHFVAEAWHPRMIEQVKTRREAINSNHPPNPADQSGYRVVNGREQVVIDSPDKPGERLVFAPGRATFGPSGIYGSELLGNNDPSKIAEIISQNMERAKKEAEERMKLTLEQQQLNDTRVVSMLDDLLK